jgi:hypothetical protein
MAFQSCARKHPRDDEYFTFWEPVIEKLLGGKLLSFANMDFFLKLLGKKSA